MDPFHPQIMKFITPTADPECSGKQYVELVDGVLRFTGMIITGQRLTYIRYFYHRVTE